MKIHIIYYTCNTHLPEIDELCRRYLSKIDLPIVSVSLNKSLDFGMVKLTMTGERGPLMMHKQMVAGLEASDADVVFMAESDVIYHLSHFEFTPPRMDTYYFNTNVWKMRWSDRFCIRTDSAQQISGMVASRQMLLDYYKARVKEIETKGFDRHYEPRNAPRIDFESKIPNICIRHDNNITKSKWSVDDYKNKEYAKGWREGYEIPGWDLSRL